MDDKPCDCRRGHHIADLRREGGRSAHRQEVWGPPSRKQRLREILRAGSAGAGAGAVLQGLDCSPIVEGVLAEALLVIVGVALLFAGLAYLIGKLRDARRRRHLLRPFGAVEEPGLRILAKARLGIAAGNPRPSPLRGQSCLAFGIVLRSVRPEVPTRTVMWREAATSGFAVILDDGTRVRVPAGRIRLIGSPDDARPVPRERAEARLPGSLGVAVPGELPEFPFDQATEEIIRPGDRVAILSPLEPREDPDEPPASLRAPANLMLIPVGVPIVRATFP